jgi:hypothetical protein
MICKAIVYEKENRLKEAMKMMGLSTSVHWLGWFITSIAFMTGSVLLLTLVLVGGGILGHSNPLLVFIFLEVFAMATVALSFLISVFFSRARLAAACAGIIYFVTVSVLSCSLSLLLRFTPLTRSPPSTFPTSTWRSWKSR